MYIALTGSENNKDVYIYHSFRKENGKSSSRIYKKLGKYNTLLEQFDGAARQAVDDGHEDEDSEHVPETHHEDLHQHGLYGVSGDVMMLCDDVM